MPNFANMSDAELSGFMLEFITVANANLATLDYTSSDITAMTTLRTNLTTSMAATIAARNASKAATVTQTNHSRTLKADIGQRARFISANPNVPTSLKVQLGLTPADPQPSDNQPYPPIELTANPLPSGTNVLKWKRGPNKLKTLYQVEALSNGSGNWNVINSTTRTDFEHTNQTPGVHIAYRVRACRRTLLSEPSNTAAVYEEATPPA